MGKTALEEPLTSRQIARCGAWKSPITADSIAGGGIGFAQVELDGDDLYWLESRPSEGGRVAIMRRAADGKIGEAVPAEFGARSRVHEYGGGSFAVHGGTICFTSNEDQRIWLAEGGAAPRPLTPEGKTRHADFTMDAGRRRLICVCEDHGAAGEPENLLLLATFDGGMAKLHRGRDFYGAPRLSPDGNRLAWICWDHPNMPWDGTELWVADLGGDSRLGNARRIAGGPAESIFQPEWSPDGELHFVSDRTGWWNLYRWAGKGGETEALCPMQAECGQGFWQFGMATYGFVGGGDIVMAVVDEGEWGLHRLVAGAGSLKPIDLPFADYYGVRSNGDRVAFIAAGDREPSSVVLYDSAADTHKVIKQSSAIAIDAGYLSAPEAVSFPTSGGDTAHGFLYMPTNRDFAAPEGELPPLIVKGHGGPTSQARRGLNLKIQYWTSRGFAYLDVNYRGSTGFGAEYRRKLDGQWGVADVEDCVAGARRLAEQGRVDGDRLLISGGSAGGYTVLAALTFHDVFKAGASHYGIGDLTALAGDTHKFESRYVDRLVGPLPEAEAVWRDRSPINHTDRLNCPVIFFQGLDDKVVPPNQAEAMVAALRSKGIPVAYVPFEGEGHGFGKAENIKRALEGELYFYGRIFGFTPADQIEPVEIENL